MMSETVFQQDEEVKRLLLERWLGERVMLEGLAVFTQSNPTRNWLVTKVEDVTVLLPNKERHHLSHTWIQKSESLKEVPEGTKIRFSATIKSYNRKDGSQSAGFSLPYNCEVLSHSKLPPVKPTVEVNKGNIVAQFTQLLIKSNATIERLGGKGKLKAFLTMIEELGGRENLAAWLDLTDDLGGLEALQQLLPFLSRPTQEVDGN